MADHIHEEGGGFSYDKIIGAERRAELLLWMLANFILMTECWADDDSDVATHCKGTASKARPRGWCNLCANCRCNSMCAFLTSDHNFMRPAIFQSVCLFIEEVDPLLFCLHYDSHCSISNCCAGMVFQSVGMSMRCNSQANDTF